MHDEFTHYPDLTEKDFERWRNFTRREFACKVTGECRMAPHFLDFIQTMRERLDFPMPVTSGYRDPVKHPEENKKAIPGAHARGLAADIHCTGAHAFKIVEYAIRYGVGGIGVSQRSGMPRFVHIDMWPNASKRPAIWSY